LILFPLGLPLLTWLIGLSIKHWPRSLKLVALILIVFCLRETKGQVDTVWKVRADFRAHQQIADALKAAFSQSPNTEQRCFSDDVGVRVLSRLPADRFVRSAVAPVSAWQDPAVFEWYLEENHVTYLVFTRIEDSLPPKLFPQLGRGSAQIDSEKFQLIAFASSPFASDVWLYRLPDRTLNEGAR
jgi:hypothetical protein